MENKEIRRRNLEVLLADTQGEDTKTKVKALAEDVRRVRFAAEPTDKVATANYANTISQYRSVTKPKKMGDAFARYLEQAREKPLGWMDAPQFLDPNQVRDAQEAADIIGRMDDDERAAIMPIIRYRRKLPPPATDAPDDDPTAGSRSPKSTPNKPRKRDLPTHAKAR